MRARGYESKDYVGRLFVLALGLAGALLIASKILK